MMRLFLTLLVALNIVAGYVSPATADSYVRLLDVRCNSAIEFFSVRETGTWRFDGPFGDLIPVDRGASRIMHARETAAEDGDLIARCSMGNTHGPIAFEVRRVGFLPPGQGLCRGSVRAAFAITLNGAELTRWSDGLAECVSASGELAPAEGRSVVFDGDLVDICAGSSVQGVGRARALTIQCQSRPIEEALRDAP